MEKALIVGGTFNPVHNGHLQGAENASKYLGLERVIFIPANIPPHKGALKIVSGEFRLRMLELATQDNPLFEVSTVELERNGPSYTIDTINELREKFGIDPTLMVGSDSLKELSTWRSMDDILRLADLAVVERVGFELKGKLYRYTCVGY